MTARRLWLLLSVLAIPLFLEANTGCQIVFPLRDPGPSTNAYTCQCSCNPGERVRDKAVDVRSDDAEERSGVGSVNIGDGDLNMTTEFLVGLRFAALGIPPTAEITGAYVQFVAGQNDPLAATIEIRIQDADDAPTFTSNAFDISLRPLRADVVTWNPNPWAVGGLPEDQRTSDLTTLIQGVVSRSLWTDTSSLVLVLKGTAGSRVAVSFDGGALRAPTLHVTYKDANATVAAKIPVCLTETDNPTLNPSAGSPDADGDGNGKPDVLQTDCENRVENSYKGLIEACGIIPNPNANCFCDLVETGFHDLNSSHEEDPGEGYFGFVREICNVDPPPVCAEVPVDATCSNFDPKAFADCIDQRLDLCGQNGIPAEECVIDDCLPFLSATNAAGDEPICIAHASERPQSLAFQLFGRRSLCEVEGLSEIQVGDEAREPKQQPLTRGTIEIFGGPCPGAECNIGISTQLAMNPITFAVSWAPDPTFGDLIEAGNSNLTAGSLSSLGVGTVAAESATGVGRGRRGSKRQAFASTNGKALGITANWGGFACSLDGDLAGGVNAEGIAGTCDGDGATPCLHDSPDCDDAGGPCTLPEDAQDLSVKVSLAGTLINQPPTADAGADQTVECTSPAGAAFTVDGTGSFDPDDVHVGDDIRIVSWREGTRIGPEVGFDRRLSGTLGVGQGKTFVLRVIDALAQADEDSVEAEVVDTTPPDVFCNTSGTIVPPNKPVAFTATATDICTAGTIVPALIDYECFKINGAGKVVDKTKSCKVTLSGPTITIKNTGGVGQHIAWTARGVDASGNVRDVTCEVEVANPGR